MQSDEGGIVLQTADGPVTLGQIDSVVLPVSGNLIGPFLRQPRSQGPRSLSPAMRIIVSENTGTIFVNIAHAYNLLTC